MTYFVDDVLLPSVAMPPSTEWHVVRCMFLFFLDMVNSRCANPFEILHCLSWVLESSQSLDDGEEMGLFTYLEHVCASKFPWGHDRLICTVGAIFIQTLMQIILQKTITPESSLHSNSTWQRLEGTRRHMLLSSSDNPGLWL